MKFMKFSIPFFLLLLGIQSAFAQSQSPLDVTLRYLEQNKKSLNLTAEDISDWVITDQYTSKHNGVTHIYMVQQYQGIKIHNAMITSNVTNAGKVLYLNNKFISDVASKVNAPSPSLNSMGALEAAARHLNIDLPNNLAVKQKINDNHVVYSKNNIALEPILTELVYQPMTDGSVRLAWNVFVYMLDGQNAWSMRLDAQTGEILVKKDEVIHCSFGNRVEHCSKTSQHTHKPSIKRSTVKQTAITAKNFGKTNVDNTYTVFAPPLESPSHGAVSMVTTTGDANASPWGWHSDNTNNYTITRGNNVHAYQDRAGNGFSSGDEPDGGAALMFDFPFNQADEPDVYVDAAVVNLFFWNNYVHDVFYNYGFDEESGNFQAVNKPGTSGFGSDEVLAEAQDDALDTLVRNNANFFSGTDGTNGRMQMYLWDQAGAVLPLFYVDSPASIAGSYTSGTASFGEQISTTPTTGELVLVDDGVGTVTDACDPIVNGADLVGKIAVIDRGDCEFGFKSLAAENEGAIGVVICNNVTPGAPGMAPGAVGAQVTIPLLSLSLDDCNAIKMIMATEPVTVTFVNPASGPRDYDGDFDNGIIVHEYGHGISNRLSGGPTSSCLNNDEQAGEGWSDFFALVLTVEAGDTGADPRGIGTYVERTDPTGGGIRRQRYSTDLAINDQDYDDIKGTTVPHPLGEVMAVTLWDLFWNMIDQYGYDNDLYNGTGGNNLAIQLVIDGLKMQGCSPGFVDARDAILAADSINNGGANQCLIWETFARRGLGIYADQGSSNDRNDGIIDFTTPEDCTEELKIRKTATASVTTDEDIVYNIEVINDSGQDLTGVVVTDEIPAGTTLVPGSITMGGTVSASVITWTIGDLVDDEELMLSFKVDPDNGSYTTVNFSDDFENGLANWTVVDGNSSGNEWIIDAGNPFGGTNAMYASDPAVESDQQLQTFDFFSISGTRPALIFQHYYDTERAWDGGVVEFQDETFAWNDLGDNMVRNGYPIEITNSLLASGSSAFTGASGGYVETVVDMTSFIGSDGFFRFRMVSDANTPGVGWFVDDVQYVDLFTIPGEEACITSNESISACVATPDIGTIVYKGIEVANEEFNTPNFGLNVFPNPAKEEVNIQLSGEFKGIAQLSILAIDGRELKNQSIQNTKNRLTLDVSDLSAGIYMIRLQTDEGQVSQKLVVD